MNSTPQNGLHASLPPWGNDEPASRQCWHIITSEYPPQVGGVSDYTWLVASGLAAQGDEVHVWCPSYDAVSRQSEGVAVHSDLGHIGPQDLSRIGKQLDRFPTPRCILVQWVPHGYGYRSMNLPFCWWLRNRALRHHDRVEIMVHEPYLPFSSGSLPQNAAALVHRIMTVLLLQAATRVWMSIPAWEKKLRPYAFGRPIPFQWLPVPSSIPCIDDAGRVQTIRERYAASGALIGHLGTYGGPIIHMLENLLNALAGDPNTPAVLLMGKGSQEFREAIVRKIPRLGAQVHAAGTLDAADLSCHVAACDVLLQPYPDGVSSRRTSVMVGLSHGKPVVTNMGALAEAFWKDTGALALAPAPDVNAMSRLLAELTANPSERSRVGNAARKLYQERFDISHTIEALRKPEHTTDRLVCAS
jgi:glycosyltransferase involved in cell wall biosynthesis